MWRDTKRMTNRARHQQPFLLLGPEHLSRFGGIFLPIAYQISIVLDNNVEEWQASPIQSIGKRIARMTIQEQIAADQQAVEAAQAALDAANAQLAADQAKLSSIFPHLSLIGRIEAEADTFEQAAKERIHALTGELRALISG